MKVRRSTVAIVVAGLLLAAVYFVRRGGTRSSAAPSGAGKSGATLIDTSGRRASGRRAKGMFDRQRIGARRIAGLVVFRGKPRPGARVSLRWAATESRATPPPVVTSDRDGRFDFGVRGAERYTVSAASPDTSESVVEVDLRDPLARPARLILRLGDCSHALVGIVSDASGTPIGGASVARVRSEGVATGDDGKFRLCLAPGPHAVRIAAQGYGALVIRIGGSGEIRRDVILVPEGTVDGVVVERGGAPVGGALVAAWPIDEGPNRAAEATTRSDARGKFELHGLGAGRFTVWGSTARLLGSTPIVVVPGTNARVRVTLDAFATLGGKVLAGDRPVAGARVYARAIGRAIGSPIGITQADGTFQLEQVPIGPVTIVVRGYEVIDPTRVVVAAPDTGDVVVHVSPLAAIAGTVIADGEPVAGASVRCVQRDLASTSSNDGSFVLRGLSPGVCRLRAELEGTGSSPEQAVTLAAGEQRTDVVLDLTQRGTIEGTVVDERGTPVDDALVAWSRADSKDSRRGRTDDRGRFRVGSLVGGGIYHPTVSLEDQSPLKIVAGQTSVRLDGRDAHANVALTVELDRRSISGTVVDQTGAGVPDARVDVVAQPRDGTAVFHGWVRHPSGTTDEDGAFTIPALPAGSYTVRARGADDSEAIVAGVAAGTRDVRLQLQRAASIEVTLSGFSETPAVDAENARGDFKKYYGLVNGDRAIITGLPPGRYIVTAHDARELDAALVDVAAGARSSVELTNHGGGRITGTVRDFETNAPVAGMACLQYPVAGSLLGGVPLGDLTSAPLSDASGRFVLDPAAAGSSAVYCYDDQAGTSSARAFVQLDAGAAADVQLVTVHREPPGLGDIGVDFDQGYPIFATRVRDDGPGARAGIRAGDQLVALGGRAVGQLSLGGVMAWIANQTVGSRVGLSLRRAGKPVAVTVVIGNSQTH